MPTATLGDFLLYRGAHLISRNNFRLVLACKVGSLFEYYDFFLFGIFSPIFAIQFFPQVDPVANLLYTYGVFATAYLMRPLGALLIGSIGDYFGRKAALLVAIWIMALATIGTGLLPTYAQIGIAAPLLLMAMRMLQGIS